MPKPIRPRRHIDGTWIINTSIAFMVAAISFVTWVHWDLWKDRKYVAAGKAACLADRPSYDYFAFCSPLADGPACTHESISRMQAWYDPVDYACAQFEPDRVFVFRINATQSEPQPLEYAERME